MKSERSPAKHAAQRMAEMHERRKDAGLVRRDRWAHPDDWPEIDALIARLTERRNRNT